VTDDPRERGGAYSGRQLADASYLQARQQRTPAPDGGGARMRHLFQPNAAVTRRDHLLTVVAWTLLVLLGWEFVSSPTFPGPSAILGALGGLWTRGVFTAELLKSFVVNVQALLWSSVISCALAYLTVVPAFRYPVEALTKLRFLGLTGLTLPFTLLFPGGDALRIAILTFAMSANYLTSMASVVGGISRDEYDHARTLRLGPWRTVWEVVILGKTDQAFEVMRQNAAIGWMMLTMVEVVSQAGGGIGLVLYKANKQFTLLPQVFAILTVILVVGYAQDRTLSWLKTVVCPYAALKTEQS
jgi:NitT/TauT family transport system permease protein